MPILILLILLVALGTTTSAAGAAGKRDTLTVTTSLGPLEEAPESEDPEGESEDEDETRPLRARGRAPKGSRLVVRFYRGSKRIATTRPKVRSGRRYTAEHPITRTGAYKVKVTATTPGDRRVTVTARLRYAPKATAPSAPEDTAR